MIKENENLRDERFMREALVEAEKGYTLGEVPVGAVLVFEDKVVARAHNLVERTDNPTAHAELLLLNKIFALRSERVDLRAYTLYVTLEPCAMCASAIMIARVGRLVYGARDKKIGGVESLYNITNDPAFGHKIRVKSGVLAEECSTLLKQFFEDLRIGAKTGNKAK